MTVLLTVVPPGNIRVDRFVLPAPRDDTKRLAIQARNVRGLVHQELTERGEGRLLLLLVVLTAPVVSSTQMLAVRVRKHVYLVLLGGQLQREVQVAHHAPLVESNQTMEQLRALLALLIQSGIVKLPCVEFRHARRGKD